MQWTPKNGALLQSREAATEYSPRRKPWVASADRN